MNSGTLYLLYQCEPPQTQQLVLPEQSKVQNYAQRSNPTNSKVLASVLSSTKPTKLAFPLTLRS